MPRFLKPCVAVLTLVLLCGSTGYAQTPGKPLTKGQLLAMVAENALSENVVRHIGVEGIGFRPSAEYRSLLVGAGADAAVLGAYDKAKVTASPDSEESSREYLQHLAAAGKLMRERKDAEAAKELDAGLQLGRGPEAAFVMGELLRRADQWGAAAALYQEMLNRSPEFPEATTKLAYNLYRSGDLDEAVVQAKAALKDNPENAEAHKNLGLIYGAMEKPEAAYSEYQEALRIKPNYEVVHYDLGLLFDAGQDEERAIAAFRKAIALNPNNADSRYHLGCDLLEKGDFDGAIREFREAKRIDPVRVDARQNLGAALLNRDAQAAIREFHELIEMSPNFAYAHSGLGVAFMNIGDYPAAEAEFRKATQLDPSDSRLADQLGEALENQHRLDGAEQIYTYAKELNPSDAKASLGLGRVLLLRKKYAEASRELRLAANLAPAEWEAHDQLGAALFELKDVDGAIAEYREALRFASQNGAVTLHLARALEKKGDAAGALDAYRRAANLINDLSTRAAYDAAEKRLGTAAGTTSAGSAEMGTTAAPSGATGNPAGATSENVEKHWTAAFAKGDEALAARHLTEAETAFKAALPLAERLRPRDERLTRTVARLGMVYAIQNKWDEAQRYMQKHVDLCAEIFGAESSQSATALEGLAGLALQRKDYPTARNSYLRAIEMEDKLLGPNDPRVMVNLNRLAAVYVSQGDYAHEEPIFLHALSLAESVSATEGAAGESYLVPLQNLYIAWGKFDKAEVYSRRVLAARERQYGANSPMIAGQLKTLSEVLTKEGKAGEAARIRERGEAVASSQ